MTLRFCLLFLLLSPLAIGATPRIQLSKPVSSSLLIVLQGSESLHAALFSKNEKKVSEDVQQLLKTVELTQNISSRSETAETLVHLGKILTTTKNRLRDVQNVSLAEKERRLSYLREFYQQIIQITRLYDVSHGYNVFFCPKDKEKAVWIQKSSKAQNPFDPDGNLKSCGVLMR
jgi:hypothetical protein